MRPILELAADRPHGVRLKYMAGCRCMLCRAANSRYETERAAARKAGDWNGLVSAKAARRHIEKLSRAGIGYKAVADASGVAASIVLKIKQGRKSQIRKRTETRILDVDAGARANNSLVPAGPTWRLIQKLIEREGFSKAEIARRLGYRTPALQLRKDRIFARTAIAVERLYNREVNA